MMHVVYVNNKKCYKLKLILLIIAIRTQQFVTYRIKYLKFVSV